MGTNFYDAISVCCTVSRCVTGYRHTHAIYNGYGVTFNMEVDNMDYFATILCIGGLVLRYGVAAGTRHRTIDSRVVAHSSCIVASGLRYIARIQHRLSLPNMIVPPLRLHRSMTEVCSGQLYLCRSFSQYPCCCTSKTHCVYHYRDSSRDGQEYDHFNGSTPFHEVKRGR